MTVKETLEYYKGKFVDVEVYRNFNSSRFGFHTDRIKSVENYDDNDEVIEEELMDEEDYSNSILANGGINADFEDWYGDKDAKVLCLKIK